MKTPGARCQPNGRHWIATDLAFPRRGEIWLVDVNRASGHEQAGIRPALVIQSEAISQTGFGTVVVLAVSKATEVKRRGILNVELRKGEGGLRLDSVVKCHENDTIDRSRLMRRFGRLSEERMAKIDHATQLVLRFHPV